MFVHGELGIGKSALLAAFLGGLDERVWVTEAHSIECCGPPEPCVPIIEALTTLAHSDDNRVISAIECAAPSWADRVLRSVARRSARNGATGGTREPLPRELCAAVEMLARITPLVIAFDDLHWADNATFDVLARLAKHRDRLSLMIVGTFRREMCTASRSGLGRLYTDLRAHFECTDIELSQLDGGGVSQAWTPMVTGRSPRGPRSGSSIAVAATRCSLRTCSPMRSILDKSSPRTVAVCSISR